jgi:hypothetical protein
MGSLKANKKGIQEVQGDFYLATAADIVADQTQSWAPSLIRLFTIFPCGVLATFALPI